MKKTGEGLRRLRLAGIGMLIWICSLCPAASAEVSVQPVRAESLFPDRAVIEQIGGTPLFAARRPPLSYPETASFSTMRAHKYLGYTTMVLAALAAVSSSSHELHRTFSYAATWLAGATCATGFSGYGALIDLSDGLDTYETHAVMGMVGTAAFAATVVIAEAEEDPNHGAIGAASATAMGLSVMAVTLRW